MSTILEVAHDMIARYGARAEVESARRAAERHAAGDAAGAQIWRRVAACCRSSGDATVREAGGTGRPGFAFDRLSDRELRRAMELVDRAGNRDLPTALTEGEGEELWSLLAKAMP